MSASESQHFQPEWIGGGGAYIPPNGQETVDGWIVRLGPKEADVCDEVYEDNEWVHCLARKYHEHPHVCCNTLNSSWEGGTQMIVSVGRTGKSVKVA